MTIKNTLLSKFLRRIVAGSLSHIRIVFAIVGIAGGVLIISALWRFNPMFALLCIPMTASVLTAFALMFAHPVKSRREGLG